MKETLNFVLKQKPSVIYSVSPTMVVEECIKKMNFEKVGALLVLDNENHLIGIFTERDVLKKVFAEEIDIKKVPVSAVMTKEMIYATPETTVEEAMATFTERRFRHLPVLDNGELVGVISIGDLTKWVVQSQQQEITLLTCYIHGEYR